MDSIAELTSNINAFRDARGWRQFHNPKDMAVSISIEAAELLELDLGAEMIRKLEKNAVKYPAEKAKRSNRKYDKLG